MAWYRIRALVVKEFLALLRNKASRMVLIGPPLIQLVVFGYAATFNLHHVPIAVYNEDRGGASRQLIARFQGSRYFSLVGMLTSGRRIANIISDKEALMVLRIGPHFSRDLELHRTARIEVLAMAETPTPAFSHSMTSIPWCSLLMRIGRPRTGGRQRPRCPSCARGSTRTCDPAGS